jgi:DNA-binding GntR family transcriptional regulator
VDTAAIRPGIALAKSQMLSELVYRAVLQMLGQGSLRRGDTLRIDALARALGVSPTPVREALARLAVTGLVVHEARKGYRIAPPLTRSELKELMDARRVIEVGSIHHAARNGGAAFRDALGAALAAQRRAVEEFHAAPSTGRAERETLEWKILEADLNFHQVVFDGTRNRFLGVMADALCAQLHRVRQTAEQGMYDDAEALAEHQAIYDAVAAGDRDAAVQAMRVHMDGVERRSIADLDMAEAEGGPGRDAANRLATA